MRISFKEPINYSDIAAPALECGSVYYTADPVLALDIYAAPAPVSSNTAPDPYIRANNR
jgi:hypothetical protein